VHTISDFRELNKCIVRKPYPIPKISMILQELEGFTYATALDINMGYYTIWLVPTMPEMCIVKRGWLSSYSWSIRLIQLWLDHAATLKLSLVLGTEVCPYFRDLA
jgi:hypothetical protein